MGRTEAATRLRGPDGIIAFFLALAGSVAFGLALQHRLLPHVAATYAAHAFFLAIPLTWWFVLSRRFPVGRLENRQLRPWYVLWALAIIGNAVEAFASPPTTIHLAAAPVLTAQLVFLALFVGPAEEFLFRGLIQTAINASLQASLSIGVWRFHAGTGLTAVLFGIWHFTNLSYQSLQTTTTQVLTAVFVGWLIGIFYDRTKNLIGACVLHNLLDFLGAATPLFAYFVAHGG